MKHPVVDREICGYCGACVSVCPSNAIELVDLHLRIDESLCIGCLACVEVCPLGAMKLGAQGETSNATRPGYQAPGIKEKRCDVLVIGGGPGGSLAAKTAAEQNVDVLMVEKRQEIGSPVRCAEAVSARPLAEFIEPNPKWVSAEINGGRIYVPDGNFVEVENPGVGLVLDRKTFDRELANQAAQSGAEVWVKARAIDLIKNNGSIEGAIIRRRDADYRIHAKVVIAADGIESQVGKWAGIDTTCGTSGVDTCAQYLMTGMGDKFDGLCHFYLGHETAPRGYAWIFPKGDGCANVGLGIGGHISHDTAVEYLNRFVEREAPNSSILGMVVGCVPASGDLSDIVRDGFMIIGDAAHQNDPVSGGGILNSMIAGQIAGEVAGQAVRSGDVSRNSLEEYQKRWHKQIGRTFRPLRKIREGVLGFSDETLNDICGMLSQKDLKKLSMLDIFWGALKREPRLLLELRHLIKLGWAQLIDP
ncbi:geranylgeranyl reductase family protein [Candidatus Poribacteria bacterium]